MNKIKRCSATSLLALALLAGSFNISAETISFTWRNDSQSDTDTSLAQAIRSGNSVTFANFQAFNKNNKTISELAFIVPWVFPKINDIVYSMDWSNSRDGWYNGNVDGTSLLITLDNVMDRLGFGEVANDSGRNPLTDTKVYRSTAETRLPGDEIPFLSLGEFAPKEAKTFDLTFTYRFGDGRQLDGQAPFTIASFYTIEPIATGAAAAMSGLRAAADAAAPVPEPGSLSLLGLGLVALLRQRCQSRPHR